ncbi:MAG: adenosylcobalamin-dependent ribonucleoside-diphosphate reductase [Nitrososphaeria archaeon]
MIEYVIKRDGRVVKFDRNKIVEAVWKAEKAVGIFDRRIAEEVADAVVQELEQKGRTPHVEEIQDIVEKKLVEKNQYKIAKAYILYRQKRAEIREEKKKILGKDVIDEVDKVFDLNALRVLASRYLKKDENGKIAETPKQLFTRVAVHVGLPEILYDPRVYSKDPVQPQPSEQLDENEKIVIGKYELNVFHKRALKELYDKLNEQGHIKVKWSDLVRMLNAGEFRNVEEMIDKFYDLMVSKRFLPNTPALINFGSHYGMGSACFVLDIEDSLESIMDTLKQAALIFQAGGGVGYNFSKLRPEGDVVKSTGGIASGPISFMKLFDFMTEIIKQGGVRRGANMGILNINHPDILKFITAKKGNQALRNFNISVLIFPDFWEALNQGKKYPLINPRNNKVVGEVDPLQVLDLIAYQAWESAEPGVIFYDNVNRYNPLLEALGPIVATNPCGEVLLYPNESCNLGSVNVWAFVKEKDNGEIEYDWDGLKETVMLATRFLDNVIEINKYPLKSIEEMTKKTRKVGLGVMGVADLLFELRLPYDSEEGRKFMERLMEFINYYSKVESVRLAEERGPFPLFPQSRYAKGELPFSGFYDRSSWHFDWEALAEEIKRKGIRNAYTTVIAPTGSISMIAGASSGIEPVFALVYEKDVTIGSFQYMDPVFEKVMTKLGILDAELLRDVISRGGKLTGINYIPEDIKRVFVTALEISPEDHIKAQAAFQKWVDSSISKTVNMPSYITPEEVRQLILMAHDLGIKDLTVYRDKSLQVQVLKAPEAKEQEKAKEERPKPKVQVALVAAASGTAEQETCPVCGSKLVFKEGCATCPICGWSACASA